MVLPIFISHASGEIDDVAAAADDDDYDDSTEKRSMLG
jgi:hypothetical protein